MLSTLISQKIAGVLMFAGLAPAAFLVAQAQTNDKVPITTASAEARDLYLKGRDLAEKLRATDARRFYEQAVQKDSTFALGYVGLANTSGTTKQFIDAVTRAAALAGSASPGEVHIIRGLEANMKGDPAGALNHYKELVASLPERRTGADAPRATRTSAGRSTRRPSRVSRKATSINPSFSQPYNQLGYAYRFLEKFDDAEKAFKKYTELIPGDPNPYDSYAELLMKVGRFDESITMYDKALRSIRTSSPRTSASATTTWRWASPIRRARRSRRSLRSRARPASGGPRTSGPRRHTSTKAPRTRRSTSCRPDTRSRRRSRTPARCPAI